MSNFMFKFMREYNRRSMLTDRKYFQKILTSSEFNKIITNKILSTEPFAVSRIGATEIDCIYSYYKNKRFNKRHFLMMQQNAGFFPVDNRSLERFSKKYFEDIHYIDLFGYWKNSGEDKILNKFSSQDTKITKLKNLEPYYHENPWTKALKGKKVLVIHPFVNTIERQYANKDNVYADGLLPDFTLITLSPPQTIGGVSSEFESWFQALDYTINEINNIDFDIALIGAGAYGLPLASHIKQMNKQAIHLGGSLQIVFGIKGKRWDDHPFISNLYNEHWVRPNENEKPKNYQNVEEGCYW